MLVLAKCPASTNLTDVGNVQFSRIALLGDFRPDSSCSIFPALSHREERYFLVCLNGTQSLIASKSNKVHKVTIDCSHVAFTGPLVLEGSLVRTYQA